MGAALGTVLGVYLYRLQPFDRPAERRGLMTLLAVLGTLLAVRVALPELLPDTEGRFFAYAVPVGGGGGGGVVGLGARASGRWWRWWWRCNAGFIAATAPSLAGAAFTSALEPLAAGDRLRGGPAWRGRRRCNGRNAWAGSRRRALAVGAATGRGVAGLLDADGAAGDGGAGVAGAGGGHRGRGLGGDRAGAARPALDGAAGDDADAADGAGPGGAPDPAGAAGEGPGHVSPQHARGNAGGAGGEPDRGGRPAGAGRARTTTTSGRWSGRSTSWRNNIDPGGEPARQHRPRGERTDQSNGHVLDGDGAGAQAAAAGARGGLHPRSTTARGWSTSSMRKAMERGEAPTPRSSATPGPRPQAKEQAIVMLADLLRGARAGHPSRRRTRRSTSW